MANTPDLKWFERVSIWFSGKDCPFSDDYLFQLGNLLAKPLSQLSGIPFTKKVWFMFSGDIPSISKAKGAISATGYLIGPDSVGSEAHIHWIEKEGMPIEATWTMLPLKALRKRYLNPQVFSVPIALMPFEVEWQPFWESQLPDFYLCVHLAQKPEPRSLATLLKTIEMIPSKYWSHKVQATSLTLHIDFSSECNVAQSVRRIFTKLKALHRTIPIKKVSVGPSE